MQREFLLVKRNAFLYIFRFFLTMFMAVVTATLFLRTQLHPNSVGQAQLYFGVGFFSLIMLMFDGFAEMTFTILRLPGFYKQRGKQDFLCGLFFGSDTQVTLEKEQRCGIV